MGRSALSSVLAAAWVLGTTLAAAASPPYTVELSFELDARVETPALDATVRAAARLLMESERKSDGGVRLSLLEPLAPAWKLYTVDPAGPLGEEAKLGAVVTLAEPSWEALAQASDEVDRLGRDQHRRLADAGLARLPFDGSFAFVVIGPPRGRFLVEVARSGRVTSAVDRLTDRWLPGDLDAHLAAWRQAEAAKRAPPHGYWFWNHGETRPFPWEPHTYHALAAALDLLALPLFPDDDAERAAALGSSYALGQERVAETARRVLETLAPKVRGKLLGEGGGSALFHVSAVSEREVVVEGGFDVPLSGARSADTRLRFSRRAVFDRTARQTHSDEVEVELTSAAAKLALRVGYHPPLSSLTPAGL